MCAGVTHWQSPNFFAYYPANSSFPGASVLNLHEVSVCRLITAERLT